MVNTKFLNQQILFQIKIQVIYKKNNNNFK